jgi:hypothetical protein
MSIALRGVKNNKNVLEFVYAGIASFLQNAKRAWDKT